jgi:hypothetical protein
MIDVARTRNCEELECVICGFDFTSPEGKGGTRVTVGRDASTDELVFACATCCGEHDEREQEQA